jgi:hypothetical protein
LIFVILTLIITMIIIIIKVERGNA